MVLTSEASLEKNERYVVIWLSEPHGTFDFDLQSLIYFPLNYTIGQQPAAATAGQHCALGWPPIFVGHCHQPSCEELWSLPALCSRLRKLICLLHLHIGRIIEKKIHFCYCLTIYWFLLVAESITCQPWIQMQLHEIHHWINQTPISFWELLIDKDNICKCHVEIPKNYTFAKSAAHPSMGPHNTILFMVKYFLSENITSKSDGQKILHLRLTINLTTY